MKEESEGRSIASIEAQMALFSSLASNQQEFELLLHALAPTFRAFIREGTHEELIDQIQKTASSEYAQVGKDLAGQLYFALRDFQDRIFERIKADGKISDLEKEYLIRAIKNGDETAEAIVERYATDATLH
jgi:hypothetical protein